MNKSELFLKAGLLLVMALCILSSARAQSNNQVSGIEKVSVTRDGQHPVSGNQITALPQDTLRITSVEKASRISQGRNCDPVSTRKPYCISRKDFDNLPKDRQQFVLDNINKYTIIE